MANRNASKSIAKTNSSTNGILQINGAQTSRAKQAPKPVARLKVIVRRLPPGLLESEFKTIIGEEWECGKERVDYLRFKKGKESKDGSKQSRPSWAVLHLQKEQDVKVLDETIRGLTFQDAANTWNSSCLVGPPIVEYATYHRVPTGRTRQDARQGTIDQDPEFMAFLDSLVNPVTSREEPEDGGVNVPLVKGAKVMVTPLVQFIKDKKAKKSDKIDTSRPTKVAPKLEVKTVIKSNKSEEVKKGDVGKKEKPTEKTSKEVSKIIGRPPIQKTAPDNATVSTNTAAAQKLTPSGRRTRPTQPSSVAGNASVIPTESSAAATKARPARVRASAATAASILQRDLGLGDGRSPSRRSRTNTVKAGIETSPASQNLPPTSPRNSRSRTRGQANATKDTRTPSSSASIQQASPVILKKAPSTVPSQSPPTAAAPIAPIKQVQSTSVTPAARRQPQNPTPSNSSATRAFVKHANPSQGVTEPLLKIALEEYGKTTFIEIDKRKGFAYADFADHEGLKNAMKNSPIKVGDGTVVVLERKDRGDVKSISNVVPPVQDVHKSQTLPPQGPRIQSPSRGGGSMGMGGPPHPTMARNMALRSIGRRGGRGMGRGGANSSHVGDRPSLPSTEPTAE